MIPLLKPFAISASGFSIDSLMNAASLPLRTWSRLGPVVPLVPASDSVWHAPQGVAPVLSLPFVNSALASGAGPGASPPPPPPAPAAAPPLLPARLAPQAGKVRLRHTVPGLPNKGVPEPHSSAQTIWWLPI